MEDKLLIWKFRRGSRDALRRIYDKHHGHLLKLAVVLTGNVDAAEDVVQEVFVNFARSADRFGLFLARLDAVNCGPFGWGKLLQPLASSMYHVKARFPHLSGVER